MGHRLEVGWAPRLVSSFAQGRPTTQAFSGANACSSQVTTLLDLAGALELMTPIVATKAGSSASTILLSWLVAVAGALR